MDNSDSENQNLVVKKFSQFIKYKNKSGMTMKSYKKQDQGSTFTCNECGKKGHIKLDCPLLKLKNKLE